MDLSRWTAEAFGASFDLAYPGRGRQAARAEVAALAGWPELAPATGVIVDLSCGSGRHVEAWRARGRRALGLDLSAARLAVGARREPGGEPAPVGSSAGPKRSGATAARASSTPTDPLGLRADRRRAPLATGSCDIALLLFQSLGYGAPEEDDAALGEAARVVRRGGVLVLELLDAERVRRDPLPPTDELRGGVRVRARRRLDADGSHVTKRVRLEHPDGRRQIWTERVRPEERERHEARLRRTGWEPLAAFGGLDRRPHRPGSGALWLVARAAG